MRKEEQNNGSVRNGGIDVLFGQRLESTKSCALAKSKALLLISGEIEKKVPDKICGLKKELPG